MAARVAGLLVLSLLASSRLFAQSPSCATPLECIEQSLQDLREAQHEIEQYKRAVDERLRKIEAREVLVLTGRVLITVYHNDTFAGPYEGAAFGQSYVLPEINRGEHRNRGQMGGRVDFPEPFASIPTVLIALSTIDTHSGTNTRIRVSVDEVDTNGFKYRFHVWGNTRLYRAEASWIAMGDGVPE